MTKSTITVKYQTTVPKEVRERLRVGPGDSLEWEVVGDYARVTAAESAGDLVDNARQARKLPPGAGAFDSGYTDIGDRTDEILDELGFGKDRL